MTELLCGLEPKDLTLEQLDKIHFIHLPKLLPYDPRIEKFILDKITSQRIENVKQLFRLSTPQLKLYPSIVKKYNEYLRNVYKEVDSQDEWRTYPYGFVKWDILDDCNRKTEVDRFVQGRASSVEIDVIDYTWIDKNIPNCIPPIIQKVIQDFPTRYHHEPFINLLKNLPQPFLTPIIDQVLADKRYGKFSIALLQNPDLPDKYLIQLLRVFVKRTSQRVCEKLITKEILNQLPSMTRFKVIENMLFENQMPNVTREDFERLIFSPTMKHPERVVQAIRKFNLLYKGK